MAVDFIQKSAGNSASTTLSSSVSNTDTSFPLTSDTNFLAGGGLVIIDEGTANEELAYYTGKSGSALTIPLANRGLEGGSAQAHSAGATVKGVLSADMWNNAMEAMSNVVKVSDGSLDTTKVQTPLSKATASEVATGTDDAKYLTSLSAVPLSNNSLYRQAIINGNFDVWQRGTSFSQAVLGDAGNRYGYTADRWYNQFYGGVGNSGDYTVTVSQQAFTLGQTDVPNEPKYFHRVAITGVATLGSNTGVLITTQKIESVRTLAGKKATVSFYAKADVNRTIGVVLSQNFGTGGSPSAHVEATESTTVNLTTSWQKFTVTFNVPSISGKTLGTTAGTDCLELAFVYYKQDNNVYAVPSGAIGAHAASTYDIAQVQLCAGDVALPFQPKGFEEELRACMRYFEKSYDYGTAIGTLTTTGAHIQPQRAGAVLRAYIPFRVRKRAAPSSCVVYGTQTGATSGQVSTYDYATGTNLGNRTAISTTAPSESGFLTGTGSAASSNDVIEVQWTAEAEL